MFSSVQSRFAHLGRHELNVEDFASEYIYFDFGTASCVLCDVPCREHTSNPPSMGRCVDLWFVVLFSLFTLACHSY